MVYKIPLINDVFLVCSCKNNFHIPLFLLNNKYYLANIQIFKLQKKYTQSDRFRYPAICMISLKHREQFTFSGISHSAIIIH